MSFISYNYKRIANGLLNRFGFMLSDSLFLRLRYIIEFNKKLNLDKPTLFNEKLQWLKLYNRNAEYTMMVDKYAVKKYVEKMIGSKYVIPTIAVWNTTDDIDFEALPPQFVLKTTHVGGSTGVIICKDKKKLDKAGVIEKLNSSLRENPYDSHREWPYKNVQRKVIAEKYMEDKMNEELVDYKFFCFNGVPKLCQVISDRKTEEKIDFYDMNWTRIPGLVGLNPKVHNSSYNHSMPSSFELMKDIATKLSNSIPFSRIDLYEINGMCYFGEITFFPAGGFGHFRPDEWNKIIGEWIILPETKIR